MALFINLHYNIEKTSFQIKINFDKVVYYMFKNHNILYIKNALISFEHD